MAFLNFFNQETLYTIISIYFVACIISDDFRLLLTWPVLYVRSKLMLTSGNRREEDTNNDENSCSNNIISIAINKYGNCCGILKHSIGTINYNDLKIILNEANIVAKSIFNKIEEYNQSLLLHDNNKIDIPLRIGFLV